MKHTVEISTVEALLINKALRLDMQNGADNEMAENLIDKINRRVEKDLATTKITNLEGKCGSCKWAKQRHSCYIDCTCPEKKSNWFARTNTACKKYERKLE